MSGKKRSNEKTILEDEIKVVNFGISTFADDLRSGDERARRDQDMLTLLEELRL